jgi:integrase
VTADAYVFPGAEGERLIDVKTAWKPVLKAASVTGFRFHDLRHTFASRLVMANVDLNTVRELLGHADLKMTLRYAHLAPEHKAAAVATLSQGRRGV